MVEKVTSVVVRDHVDIVIRIHTLDLSDLCSCETLPVEPDRIVIFREPWRDQLDKLDSIGDDVDALGAINTEGRNGRRQDILPRKIAVWLPDYNHKEQVLVM